MGPCPLTLAVAQVWDSFACIKGRKPVPFPYPWPLAQVWDSSFQLNRAMPLHSINRIHDPSGGDPAGEPGNTTFVGPAA